ncbi:MAG TPA: pseudouridine synthase [Kofleriaceae bacterium]|jgi:23S rRNA pseudouridine2605 synthase|nr:pseudouridine synthase [Kofleriaceae bacterium]
MSEQVRLQRYLSQAGVAARRKAEDLIVAGRVTVNGKVVRELGSKVDPDKDRVSVDGEGVHPEEHFYIVFNKPKGCITAVTDDRGRMTVMDYLPNLPARVAPVGRLDFYSEGVLLLTNDGELAARLLSAKHHVPKTYHVKVRGEIAARDLDALRTGVRLEDGTITQPAEIEMLPAESRHTWIAVTLYEGKQRQIHRMLETRGYRVDKLQRVAFGSLTFHGLRVGDARELNQQELNELRDEVGLDRQAVARGRWSVKREETDLTRRARERAALEGEPIPREAPRARNVDPHSFRSSAARPSPGRAAPDRPERSPKGRVEGPAKKANAGFKSSTRFERKPKAAGDGRPKGKPSRGRPSRFDAGSRRR